MKSRATEIYALHIALAHTDPRLFRKTVREQLMQEFGASEASVSTHYNNCKKAWEAQRGAIEGLGRSPVAPGVRKMGGTKAKPDDTEVDDDDCFSVIELVEDGQSVGRCQAFILQGDASEKFDGKIETWPNCTWVMIKGLGPIHGDSYKLGAGEKEIKRYTDGKVEEFS